MLSMSQKSYAQTGMASVPFLTIEPDAYGASLGNTGVARLNSGYASFWNPALLGFDTYHTVRMTHTNWLPGFSDRYMFDYISGTAALSKGGAISGDLTYFSLGEQLARDNTGQNLGNFSNYELATSLSYGKKITETWALGIGAKYIQSSLGAGQFANNVEISEGKAFAFNMGLLYNKNLHSSGGIRVGLALQNFGRGIQYMDGVAKHPLPATFRFGWEFDLPSNNSDHRITLSNEVSKPLARIEQQISGNDTSYVAMSSWKSLITSWSPVEISTGQGVQELSVAEQIRLGLGLEYGFKEWFFIRAGYYYEDPWNGDRNYMTLGAGLNISGVGVDLSYILSTRNNDPLANTLRISLRANIGKPTPYIPSPNVYRAMRFEAPKEQMIQPIPIVELRPTEYISLATEFQPLQNFNLEDSLKYASGILRNFDIMSSTLKDEHSRILEKVGDWLLEHTDQSLLLTGHADSTGADEINAMLSEARATSVELSLIGFGIEPYRIVTQAKGSSEPLESNPKQAFSRGDNRRVELTISDHKEQLLKASNARMFEVVPQAQEQVLLKRDDISFDYLALRDTMEVINQLAGIVSLLNEDENLQLWIISGANYLGSGIDFINEIVKARAQKIESILLHLGSNPQQIEAIIEPTFDHAQIREKYLEPNRTEQLILVLVNSSIQSPSPITGNQDPSKDFESSETTGTNIEKEEPNNGPFIPEPEAIIPVREQSNEKLLEIRKQETFELFRKKVAESMSAYSLNIGAFKNIENAEKYAQKFEKIGFLTNQYDLNTSHGRLKMVSVGEFESRDYANFAAKALEEWINIDYQIIQSRSVEPENADEVYRLFKTPVQSNQTKSSKYTVIVGAFKSIENAKKYYQEFSNKNFITKSFNITHEELGSLNGVSIGEFNSLKEARSAAESLQSISGITFQLMSFTE